MIEDDTGYAPLQAAFAQGMQCFVYLDGAEIRHCTTADEEEGFVIVDVLNDAGFPQVNPDNPEEFWTERREGTVKVEFRQK